MPGGHSHDNVKTLSAREYARWDLIESARPLYLWRGEPPAAVLPCRTVVYTAPVVRAPSKIARDIRDLRQRLTLLVEDAVLALQGQPGDGQAERPPDYTELLIVDEADRLKLAGLEQLRDIYDRGGLGLILIGMSGLERRMARYPQLYSRVGFVHQYRPLGSEELRFVLEHKWRQLGLTLDPTDYTDVEATAAVARITGGNFRLLQRLFAQVERILQINGLRTITGEVVQAARENLVIGAA